jgi:serine/threonine protein kinase
MAAFVSRLSLLSWYRKVAFCAVGYVKVSVTLESFVGNLVYLRTLRCIEADFGVKRFQAYSRRNFIMFDWLGQQFGSYQLVDFLGQGGFADVYLGEHVYYGTQAAIKVPRSGSQDERERFVKEIRTLSGLHHPHIVRVLEYAAEGDIPFLAMNYARRGSLRQIYRKGTLFSLETIVSYVMQIADGLQYIHDRRLVHCDVKLGNILLGPHGTVWLSDFGIAVNIPRLSLLGKSRGGAGTVNYISPEQLQGFSCPASDQYALGVVVYELLTGDTPFHGNDREIAEQHLYAAPPRLHSRFLEITPAVEQVVRRALAKDPQVRFDSVWDFAMALEQASKMPAVEIRRRSSVVDPPAAVISWRHAAIEEPEVVIPRRRVARDPSPLLLHMRSAVALSVTDPSGRRVAV